MTSRGKISPVILTLLAGWCGIIGAAQEQDDWRATVGATCQVPDEPWRTIPWQTDLLAAQRLALEQDKPLFVWAMDGHPLGCT